MIVSFRTAIPALMQGLAMGPVPLADPGVEGPQDSFALAEESALAANVVFLRHALFSPKLGEGLGEPKVFVDEPERMVRLIYGQPFDMKKPRTREQCAASEDYRRSCEEYPIAYGKGLYDLDTKIVGTLATVQLRAFSSDLDRELDSLIERLAFHRADRQLLEHIASARSLLYIVKMHSRIRGGAGAVIVRDILDLAQRHRFDLVTVSTLSDPAARALQHAGFVERNPVLYWEEASQQRSWIHDLTAPGSEARPRQPRFAHYHFGTFRERLVKKVRQFELFAGSLDDGLDRASPLRQLLAAAHDDDLVMHIKTPGLFCLAQELPREIDGQRVAAHTIYAYSDFPRRALASQPWILLEGEEDTNFYLYPVLRGENP